MPLSAGAEMFLLRFFSIIGYYKTLDVDPHVIRHVFTGYLFYI